MLLAVFLLIFFGQIRFRFFSHLIIYESDICWLLVKAGGSDLPCPWYIIGIVAVLHFNGAVTHANQDCGGVPVHQTSIRAFSCLLCLKIPYSVALRASISPFKTSHLLLYWGFCPRLFWSIVSLPRSVPSCFLLRVGAGCLNCTQSSSVRVCVCTDIRCGSYLKADTGRQLEIEMEKKSHLE